MNNHAFWLYLAIMALSTYLIRAIPFVMLRKKIQNPFIRSFLYYIPYTVLTVMTVPGALYATGHVITAAAGLFAAVLIAFRGKSLTVVAAGACMSTFLMELILHLIG
ncbi:MAG: AzlD domain-containing protein [Clostridia bacterium]|nr:AzlD domain-containing protein [Clostridia bacterium]